MARQATVRLLVIDGQPATHAGIRFLVQTSEKLRRFSVKEHSAPTFEDGLAAAHDEVPDVILLDVNLPQAFAPGPINLFRATHKLRSVCPQTPILLLYAPPAPLASVLLLLRQGLAEGLLAKADLTASRLHSAVTRLQDGWPYLCYGGQEHKLSDLTAGLGFFKLRDEQARLIELLDQTDHVPTIAAQVYLTAPSVYRQLQGLAVQFGVRNWKDVPDRARRLGILDQGQVVCPAAFSQFNKLSAPPR